MAAYLWEILMAVAGMLSAILVYIVKQLNDKVDKTNNDLANHRVDDVKQFITRKEHSDRETQLKDDIRGMISPIRISMENIEKYLREKKK